MRCARAGLFQNRTWVCSACGIGYVPACTQTIVPIAFELVRNESYDKKSSNPASCELWHVRQYGLTTSL